MPTVDQQWTNLRTLDDASLVAEIRDRMVSLNQQSEDQQAASLAAVLQAEAEMDDADLHRLTAARFRAWLSMSADGVQAYSTSLDQARARTSAAAALRTTGADQAAARELSADECMRLLKLAPSFERALPVEVRDMVAAVARRERADAQVGERAAARRPFWKFWQR